MQPPDEPSVQLLPELNRRVSCLPLVVLATIAGALWTNFTFQAEGPSPGTGEGGRPAYYFGTGLSGLGAVLLAVAAYLLWRRPRPSPGGAGASRGWVKMAFWLVALAAA